MTTTPATSEFAREFLANHSSELLRSVIYRERVHPSPDAAIWMAAAFAVLDARGDCLDTATRKGR